MSALNDLVRKFKKAVTGVEAAGPDTRPFQWEPAPAVATAPAVVKEEGPREAAPAPSSVPLGWKRAAPEASSLVGAPIPADVADFATVYKGASVQAPSHGYGVERIAGMLAHKSLAGLDKSVKSSAVLAALDAASVSVHDVIHDGLLRYKALVAFEAAKELELYQVRPRNERRIEELKVASEAFQKKKHAEIDALTRESAGAMASLTRLKTRQRGEEERFHRAISLFVEPLPARVITMTPKPAEAPAAPPAEAKPELKLVAAIVPAAPKAADEPKVVTRAEPPKVEAPATATQPKPEPAKDEVKS